MIGLIPSAIGAPESFARSISHRLAVEMIHTAPATQKTPPTIATTAMFWNYPEKDFSTRPDVPFRGRQLPRATMSEGTRIDSSDTQLPLRRGPSSTAIPSVRRFQRIQ